MSNLLPHASQRPVVWHLVDLMEEKCLRTLLRCFPWLVHDEAPNGCGECEDRDGCRRRLAPEGEDVIAWLVSDMKAVVGRQASNGGFHSRKEYRKLAFDELKNAVFAFVLPQCRRNRWVGFIIKRTRNSDDTPGHDLTQEAEDLIQEASFRVQSRLFRQTFEAEELFWGWFKNPCVWLVKDGKRRGATIRRNERQKKAELRVSQRHLEAKVRRADRERDQNDIHLEAVAHSLSRLSADDRRFFLAYHEAPYKEKGVVAGRFGMTKQAASMKYKRLKTKLRMIGRQYLLANWNEDC